MNEQNAKLNDNVHRMEIGVLSKKNSELSTVNYQLGGRGGAVVKVLCYKSEGRWFDPRWCHWNISLT